MKPRRDSNPQSEVQKTPALSVGPRGLKLLLSVISSSLSSLDFCQSFSVCRLKDIYILFKNKFKSTRTKPKVCVPLLRQKTQYLRFLCHLLVVCLRVHHDGNGKFLFCSSSIRALAISPFVPSLIFHAPLFLSHHGLPLLETRRTREKNEMLLFSASFFLYS